MKPLTQRQKEVYEVINGFVQEKGYFPTMREIALILGTENISTVQYFMEQLKQKGRLKYYKYHRSGGILK